MFRSKVVLSSFSRPFGFSYQKKRVEQTLRASGILTKENSLDDFFRMNRLADNNEMVRKVFHRATRFLAEAGEPFYGRNQVDRYQSLFEGFVDNFEIILGTPILANGGRDKSQGVFIKNTLHF